MNRRKFFGTIIGLIFWAVCICFFTYAYYDWKSEATNVVLGIEDLSVECLVGANVNATNIGPVLNYQDGVKAEFSIDNSMTDNMAIELYLDITSISDNLLTESLKYVLVADSTGGTNYDYDNPIREGNFSNFNVGNNLVTQDLEVTADVTTNYQFIIYIDGNMYNDPNMQENSLTANLMIGNCDENAVSMNELVYQAIYSETDNSLTFVHTKPLTVGETYNDKAITAVYTGFETAIYQNQVPWYSVRENITTVNFDSIVKPRYTINWFNEFTNLTSINIEKLDTSQVRNMSNMFYDCSSLVELDVSNWDTSNVTNMSYMFFGCSSLVDLDISNFDTSKVTYMNGMFSSCSSLTELDVSNFDTSKVTNMIDMFKVCKSLTELELSNFDTSNVTSMTSMFYRCSSLTELDVSNWDTSNVTGMTSMFYNCRKLTKLDLSNWDTSNVTSMNHSNGFYGMFEECSSLIILDISNFDTSKITNMGCMFRGCSSLVELDVSSFDTSNVTNMNYMFRGCSSLITLNLSNFDTSSVKKMVEMFMGCSSLLSLDLSNFDTRNVTDMNYMFSGCNLLTTEINIMNTDTTYNSMFYNAATTKDSEGNYIGHIIINYIPDNPNTTDVNESTEALVDAMKATGNGNLEKGCLGINCPVDDEGTDEGTV